LVGTRITELKKKTEKKIPESEGIRGTVRLTVREKKKEAGHDQTDDKGGENTGRNKLRSTMQGGETWGGVFQSLRTDKAVRNWWVKK